MQFGENCGGVCKEEIPAYGEVQFVGEGFRQGGAEVRSREIRLVGGQTFEVEQMTRSFDQGDVISDSVLLVWVVIYHLRDEMCCGGYGRVGPVSSVDYSWRVFGGLVPEYGDDKAAPHIAFYRDQTFEGGDKDFSTSQFYGPVPVKRLFFSEYYVSQGGFKYILGWEEHP